MEKDILEIKEKPLYEFTDSLSDLDMVSALGCNPKSYWLLVFEDLLIFGIIPIIIGAYKHSILWGLGAFLVLFILASVRVKLEFSKIIADKVKKKNPGRAFFPYKYRFYETYFIVSDENRAAKYLYTDISNFLETSLYLIMEERSSKKDIILNLKDCPDDIITFLQDKLTSLKNDPKKKFIDLAPQTKSNAILTILLCFTILSLYGALMTLSHFAGKEEVLDLTKKMWILYTWLPIPLLSIIMGFRYQQSNGSANKNIIVGIFVSIFLLIFGSFSFLFNDDLSFEYDTIMNINRSRELHMNISYPGNLGLKTSNYKVTIVTYQSDEIPTIEEQIKNNSHWLKLSDIKEYLKDNLPSKLMTSKDAYYLIYNKTSNEYNSILEGENEIEVIIFNPSTYSLEIHAFTLEK